MPVPGHPERIRRGGHDHLATQPEAEVGPYGDTSEVGDELFDRRGDRLVVEMDRDSAPRNLARTIMATMNPPLKTIARAEPGRDHAASRGASLVERGMGS